METIKHYDVAKIAQSFEKVMRNQVNEQIIYAAQRLFPDTFQLPNREMKIVMYQAFDKLSSVPLNERDHIPNYWTELIGILINEHFGSCPATLFFEQVEHDHPGAKALRSDLVESAIATAFKKALIKESKDLVLIKKSYGPSARYERGKTTADNIPEQERNYPNFVLDGIKFRERHGKK